MKFHPPFSQHTDTPYVHLDTGRCEACWDCVDICPQQVIGKVDFLFHRHARIDRSEHCKGCMRCVKICPSGAIFSKEKVHDNVFQ